MSPKAVADRSSATKRWPRLRNISTSYSSELDELRDALETTNFCLCRLRPVSAPTVPAGSRPGDCSPDSAGIPLGIATVTVSKMGTSVCTVFELMFSLGSTESIPVTRLGVMKDL
ncbi:hypothetical protein AAC387_Pa12g0957 [Persea americana]